MSRENWTALRIQEAEFRRDNPRTLTPREADGQAANEVWRPADERPINLWPAANYPKGTIHG